MVGCRPTWKRVLLGTLVWYCVFTILYGWTQHLGVIDSIASLFLFSGGVATYRWRVRLLLSLVVSLYLVISAIASCVGALVMEGRKSTLQTTLLSWLCWLSRWNSCF